MTMIRDIIDKIKHHGHSQEEQEQRAMAEKVAEEKAAIAAATAAAEKKRQKEASRGPEMHPDLLELYTITDHVLGVGTFATVKEIKLKSTGKSYALKIILKKTLVGKTAMLDTEISVLSKVRHPNCVSLLELFETKDAVYLVTDLAEGGELFDQLLQKGSYTEGDAARLVHEILLGVEYLHKMDIVHRDLKPENLLFMDKSENARLMITDFGLSKVLTSGNDVLMTACGTPGYVAPEVLEQIGHGKPVDIWSIGVIAYTLLCGYTPFWGEDQPSLFESIISGEYEYEEEYWKDVSPLAKSFIDSLLVRPAEKRPTATQALNHPWFRTMLEADMVTPTSPIEDSVNLLPGMRKNFNARSAFKKAVRAVGLLRKMQAASSGSSGSSFGSGEDLRSQNEVVVGGKKVGGRPTSMGLSFHDVVSAALINKKGLDLGSEVEETDDENLDQVNAVLKDLTIKDV
ncbi:calcium/calmodulin-dependent protein kinase I [Entomortierella parvispora]|uniref:Calcium/calmodulin-dependent protein kinase I n=1 Tax=Entomortierella parvispora TaxID=205924 RepID=A0A9P3M0Z3_9FUNG|nr:calcium/calmodulin-dependent protein kinase I [Entomortierella parvispora]